LGTQKKKVSIAQPTNERGGGKTRRHTVLDGQLDHLWEITEESGTELTPATLKKGELGTPIL